MTPRSKAYQAGYAALSGAPNPYDPVRQHKQHSQWQEGYTAKRTDMSRCSASGMPWALVAEAMNDMTAEERAQTPKM